jgi:hypothetical protein
MAVFVIVLLAMVALGAVLLATLLLPGALLFAAIYGLVDVIRHVHRRHMLHSHHSEEDQPGLTAAPEDASAKLPESRDVYLPQPGSPTIGEGTDSAMGLDLVQTLHGVVRSPVAVHEVVPVANACPILAGLQGGSALANRVRCESDKRLELLESFETVSRQVAPHNIYPVAGAEVERVIEELNVSLKDRADGETSAVCDLCARALHTISDWGDSNLAWPAPDRTVHSPRNELVNALKDEAYASPCSASRVLEAWDNKVDVIAAELTSAQTDAERGRAAHRLMAAIAIHDSVESGVLCPILKHADGGDSLAARLRKTFAHHAMLQRSWNELSKGLGTGDVYRVHREGAEDVLDALVQSFRAHRHDDMSEVAEFLETLPSASYRTVWSPLADVMWPWHSEGAALLAIRMALWAESAPTRAHTLTVKHPSSRTLRSFTGFADHLFDHWGDTGPEMPRRHARPRTRVQSRR